MTGFIGLEQYLAANQGAAQGMANAVTGSIAQQGQLAQQQMHQLKGQAANNTAASLKDVNPNLYADASKNAAEASNAADALQQPGGVSAALQKQYGQPGGYTAGMSGFDAALAGAVGGDQFRDVGSRYGGLDEYLSGMSSRYQPSAPGGKNMGVSGMSPPMTGVAPSRPERPSSSSGGGMGATWDERTKRRRQ